MLPDKWRKSKRAVTKGATDAWWYGEDDGIHVVVQNFPQARMIVSVKIPRKTLLAWADDVRATPRRNTHRKRLTDKRRP
jgi:hypothetical protein